MKKLLIVILVFIICSAVMFSFSGISLSGKNSPSKLSGRDIVLQFVTYNGYGNNLFIDNILTGIQPETDVTVTSIVNIPYDTTYSVLQSGSDTITPVVSVANIGRSFVDTVRVHLVLNSGEYADDTVITSLFSGATVNISFNQLTYTIGSPLYFKAYTSLNTDSVRTNDTLNQYSIFLPGFRRNVLFEEFTSNASPSCANNNEELDRFINSNIQTVTAIKYHLPLGLSGRDTFYSANPQQNSERSRYYYGQSFPTTIIDGRLIAVIPYGDSLNLYGPYFKRLNLGSPLSMSVTDERVNGDSVKTTVNVNILSSLQPGNYRLRINAVERHIVDSATASNGEINFYDVFRRFYPDSNGFSISVAKGNYNFSYTYYREPSWVDSMIYTAAFIQNDNTREVINCAKGRNIIFNMTRKSGKVIRGKSDISQNGNLNPLNRQVLFSPDSIQSSLNIELFEAFFPPAGWRIYNMDGYITFDQFRGANGPTFGGSRSVFMDFFDYNIPGQKDSMYSKTYSGLLDTDTLRFDYAYAQYSSSYTDSLIVKISTDGGITFPTEIFRRGGLGLATAPQTTSFFFPLNNSQWRSFKFSLSGIVGVNGLSENLPSGFKLMQNYPNPFNPSTKIKYEIPVASNVTLKVFDIKGSETAVLVNKKQNAGVYEIEFKGDDLSSGVYFYQLVTDGFTETRRMMLIR